ncbi:F-box-like domain superfamily [Arabidopsis thaliana x Arabidopsis arenosa]|uniref:F-box-like domain superfamily n=1 Tax=Arabidopsis thaliana x Arabidopsis arenosa TaxID=1240361 RepID=A0A8T2ATL9_9BRAS|nr:F-box-like domain superfamily [Arabidopsis thaliana x Arabidopsis arenosa]
MKILESLPGVVIARVSCVDSEFRNLASDNDLWKQKCLEEFADSVIEEREFRDDFVDWKAKFVECWRRNNRKARKRPRRVVSCNPFRDEGFPGRGWERGSGSTAATSVLSLW